MLPIAPHPFPVMLPSLPPVRHLSNFRLIVVTLFSLVTFTLSIWLFIPAARAEERGPDAPGSIAGVVKTADGAAQANIRVSLFQPHPYSAGYWATFRHVTTQADGQYRFALLPPGVYRVGVQDVQPRFATLYYPAAPTVEGASDIIVTGNQLTGVNFVLQPGGQITGVISATDRITMTGAEVELYQAVEQRGVLVWQPMEPKIMLPATGGAYQFTGLGPNRYRVCTYGRTFLLSIYECYDNVYELQRATTLTLTVGATISNVNIVLGDGANFAQISGRITALDQTPLAAIQVSAGRVPLPGPPVARTGLPGANEYGSWETQSNSQGNYHLTTIPAGRYYLYFRDPAGNYVAEYYHDADDFDSATAIELAPSQVISAVNVQLAPANHLRGVVTLFEQPAATGTVIVERKTADGRRWGKSGNINPITGHYALDGLPDGIYRLSGYAIISVDQQSYFYEGHFGGSTLETAAEIVLSGGETKVADLMLTGADQFSGSLSGRVTAGGKAVGGAKVSLYPENFTCCFSPSGLFPPFQPLTYVFTDQEGRYTFNGLPTRKVFLGVTDPNGIYATTYYANQVIPDASNAIMVEDGKALTGIDLHPPVAGAIRGRVTRRNGTPVAGLTVSIYLSVPAIASLPLVSSNAYTDADGRYTINGLHPGAYYLCFTAGDYTECYGSPDRAFPGAPNNYNARVNVVAGETRTNVDLLWGPDLTNYLPIIAR